MMNTYEQFKMHMRMYEQEHEKLKVKKLHERAIIPTRNYHDDSGLDLYADKEYLILPGHIVKVSTGIAIELPKGHEGQVRPRSGLSTKYGITVINTPSTIDNAYRGEMLVPLINHGFSAYTVQPGDRVAQLVIMKVNLATPEVVDELSESHRGEKGFGSSGIRIEFK